MPLEFALKAKLKTVNVKYAERGGGIRLAPHCYNSEEEIAQVLEALSA